MEHPVTSFLLTEVNIPQYAPPPALTSITSIFYIAQQSDFHYLHKEH